MKFLCVINHWPTKTGLLWSLSDAGGMCWLRLRLGAFVRSGPAGPELRPGCLHCSPDPGTDSGSVQRDRDKRRDCLLTVSAFDKEEVGLINLAIV